MAEPTCYMECGEVEQHWYAIYTKHNAEQTLLESILNYSQRNALNYEAYLPLREEVKKWRDRLKVKKSPVFKNYLFVKHDDNAFHKIKNMKGFCDYIRFGLTPSAIPIQQMELIKKVIEHQSSKYCKPSLLIKGKKVRIIHGTLAGYEGILLDNQLHHTLAIEVKSLKLCLNVNIAAADVVLI